MSDKLTNVKRTIERLKHYVGHDENKRRKITIEAVIAGAVFLKENGHIHFDRKSEENMKVGLKTIYAWIAWHHPHDDQSMPIARPTDIQRLESVQMHENTFREGFRQLVSHVNKDSHTLIYKSPQSSKRIHTAFITVNGNAVANSTGATVKQVYKRWNRIRMQHIINTTVTKADLADGTKETEIKLLKKHAEFISKEQLPPPKLSIEHKPNQQQDQP